MRVEADAAAWKARARGLRRKVNAGWVAQFSAVPLVTVALVVAGVLIWLRRHAPDAAPWILVTLAVLPAVVAPALGFLRARHHFISLATAFARLEDKLGLHNALTTASEGMGSWPPTPVSSDDGTRWRGLQIAVPSLVAVALVLCALLIPVSPVTAAPPPPEPAAWARTEDELNDLTRRRVVDEESTRETREAVETLRSRPSDKWFDHAALEATDRLVENHRRGMSELENHHRRAAAAARRLAREADRLAPRRAQALGEVFRQAIEGMEQGRLKPDRQLLEALKQLDPGALGDIDAQQLEDLLKNLEANAEALEKCLGDQPGQGDGEGDGEGQGEGQDGEDGEGNGRGGVNRGPGTNDDLFGEERENLEANRPRPLRPNDLSRTTPGDLLGVEQGEHEIDYTSPALRGGGEADTGGGGDRVWQDSLHPREREALKRFFD